MVQSDTELKCEITQSHYEEGSFSDRVHKYIHSISFEELEENLPGIFSNLNEFVSWFEGLTEELYIHSVKKLKDILPGAIDPERIEYTLIYQMWDKIGFYLILNTEKLQLPSYLVLNFYRKFLQAFVTAQKPNSRLFLRLHKGGIYHNLGISLLFSGDKEKSKSYFLLGMIEDMLSQSSVDDDNFKTAPGYSNLKSLKVFQAEIEEIEELRKIIKKYRRENFQVGVNNPELIFLEFMTSKKNKININQSLLWDNVFFKQVIKEAETNINNTELGRLLEILSSYLFFTIGKFEVSCNVKTIHAEHDLRVRNLIVNDPILELLGRYLLVECKNWGKKVNSTLVKKFITNVRFARCDAGIMITKKEITGEKGKDSAWYSIRAEYHKDGIVIIVLTMKDLKKIADEKTNLLEILKTKYEIIRFDER